MHLTNLSELAPDFVKSKEIPLVLQNQILSNNIRSLVIFFINNYLENLRNRRVNLFLNKIISTIFVKIKYYIPFLAPSCSM